MGKTDWVHSRGVSGPRGPGQSTKEKNTAYLLVPQSPLSRLGEKP